MPSRYVLILEREIPPSETHGEKLSGSCPSVHGSCAAAQALTRATVMADSWDRCCEAQMRYWIAAPFACEC